MVMYDPKKVSYSQLLEVLFKTIDPTLKDQVGNDFGTQYRHGAYCHSEKQLEAAKKIVAREQAKLPEGRMIHTEAKKATVFWPAEEMHQQFLQKGGRFGSPRAWAAALSQFALRYACLLSACLVSCLPRILLT